MSNKKSRSTSRSAPASEEKLLFRAQQILLTIEKHLENGDFDPRLSYELVKTYEQLRYQLPLDRVESTQQAYEHALDIHGRLMAKAQYHDIEYERLPARLGQITDFDGELVSQLFTHPTTESLEDTAQVKKRVSARTLSTGFYTNKLFETHPDPTFLEKYLRKQ